MVPKTSHIRARELVTHLYQQTSRWHISDAVHNPSLLLFPVLDADGTTTVTFGVLFNDDRCANIFEALVGTLKAAKKRNVISYKSELLLQGVHDDVEITLL